MSGLRVPDVIRSAWLRPYGDQIETAESQPSHGGRLREREERLSSVTVPDLDDSITITTGDGGWAVGVGCPGYTEDMCLAMPGIYQHLLAGQRVQHAHPAVVPSYRNTLLAGTVRRPGHRPDFCS